MKNYNVKNVDEYIASSSEVARPILNEIRKTLKTSVPDASEGMSWGVPFYKYQGMLAGFAAYKDHASVWFPITSLPSNEREELEGKGYVTGNKTIQIKFGQK